MSITKEIIVPSVIQPYIFGRQDSNIKVIENNMNVKLSALGDNVTIEAENENNAVKAYRLFEELMEDPDGNIERIEHIWNTKEEWFVLTNNTQNIYQDTFGESCSSKGK